MSVETRTVRSHHFHHFQQLEHALSTKHVDGLPEILNYLNTVIRQGVHPLCTADNAAKEFITHVWEPIISQLEINIDDETSTLFPMTDPIRNVLVFQDTTLLSWGFNLTYKKGDAAIVFRSIR
eukprot:PhF_6_TR35987/c0_g2_i2/m.52108